MSQFYFLLLTWTIICAINLTGTRSQSVKFYDNGEDMDECVETLRAGTDGMVLRGQAHLPKQSNWTSYIIFDQKSEAAGDFKLLCLVDTKSQCENSSVLDICYCHLTETVDTYQFVVNLSSVTTENSGLIRAYLMMKNSTTVFSQISLSSWRENNSPVKTSLTINDEPVGDYCMETIHSKKLKIEASCAGTKGPCWLELTTGHNSMPAVGDKHITLEQSVEADSNITVVLRRSRCNRENFQEMYRCQLTLVSSLEVQEASTNILLICGVVGSVIFVLAIIAISLVVFWRRKNTKRTRLRSESNEEGSDLCENKTFTNNPNLQIVTDSEKPKMNGKRSPDLRKDHELLNKQAEYISLLPPADHEIEKQKFIDADSSTLTEAKSSSEASRDRTQELYSAEEQTPTETYSQDSYYDNEENIPRNDLKLQKQPEEYKEMNDKVVKELKALPPNTQPSLLKMSKEYTAQIQTSDS